jgi:hypothetical protein
VRDLERLVEAALGMATRVQRNRQQQVDIQVQRMFDHGVGEQPAEHPCRRHPTAVLERMHQAINREPVDESRVTAVIGRRSATASGAIAVPRSVVAHQSAASTGPRQGAEFGLAGSAQVQAHGLAAAVA